MVKKLSLFFLFFILVSFDLHAQLPYMFHKIKVEKPTYRVGEWVRWYLTLTATNANNNRGLALAYFTVKNITKNEKFNVHYRDPETGYWFCKDSEWTGFDTPYWAPYPSNPNTPGILHSIRLENRTLAHDVFNDGVPRLFCTGYMKATMPGYHHLEASTQYLAFYSSESTPSDHRIEIVTNSFIADPNSKDFFVVTDDMDLSGNAVVDFADYGVFAKNFARTDCTELNTYCERADMNRDGSVDQLDLEILAGYWLYEFTDADYPEVSLRYLISAWGSVED